MVTIYVIKLTQEVAMRIVTCALLAAALVGFAYGANTPEQLADIQKVADAFLKAAVDNDFDAFKENASVARLAEYEKNEVNCPLARWWESARKAVDEHDAAWEFVKVKSNMPTNVEFIYKKTDDGGEKEVSVFMTKDGDDWHVDAAGGAF
jgi:hypothetical protein